MSSSSSSSDDQSSFSTGHDYEDVAELFLGEEMQRLDDEADAILDSIRNEITGSPLEQNNSSSFDDYDENEVDDELHDEILKLGTVTANLRQDLDEVSVESMNSHLSQQQQQQYVYQRKTLQLEAGDFLRHKQLYGPGVGGQERNTPLFMFAISVWSILVILVFHARYGNSAMDETGVISSMPRFLRLIIHD